MIFYFELAAVWDVPNEFILEPHPAKEAALGSKRRVRVDDAEPESQGVCRLTRLVWLRMVTWSSVTRINGRAVMRGCPSNM